MFHKSKAIPIAVWLCYFCAMQQFLGTVLRATALLDGSFFEQSEIIIAEHNEHGATGFVVNKLFGRNLNQLTEFNHCKPIALLDGGPVEREGLFFIHQRPDLIEEGKPIGNGIYYGGNFQQAIEALNAELMNQSQIKLFIGYCGWDAGELEAELEEGSWEIHNQYLDLFA